MGKITETLLNYKFLLFNLTLQPVAKQPRDYYQMY